ncbi:MAG: ABC transporter permease [Acetobacteraceae bacterium]
MSTAPLYWTIFRRRNVGVRGIFAVTLAFLVLYAILFPGLLQVSNIAKLSESWFPLAAAGMAQAIVMLTGGIDLSVGQVVSVGCVLSASVIRGGPFGIAGGILVVLAAGVAIGGITGLLIARLRLPSIIVTLATSFVWTGVALLIMPTPGGQVPTALSDALAGDWPGALLLLGVIAVLWKLWMATPVGLAAIAAGDNPLGAFRSGLPVQRAELASYAISGVLSVLAGFFIALQTGSGDPTIGVPYTLNSITAAVLGAVAFTGGAGTMRGTLAGALLLTVLINVMFFLGISAFYQYIAQGVVIVAAVAVPLLKRR